MIYYDHIFISFHNLTTRKILFAQCGVNSNTAKLAVPYFSTLSRKRQDFEKKQNKTHLTSNVFSFSLRLLHKTFNIPRRIQRGVFINGLLYSACHFYPTLAKLEFSHHISMQHPKIKFYDNS